MRIHHVTLIVNDLQAAGDFYVKRLGLHVRDPGPIDYPGAFLVINDEQELHLAEFADKPPSFRGHFCLRVANWSDLYRTFRDEGLLDLQPWGKVRELPGGVLQCYVRDPSGNLVELTSRPEDRGRIDPTVFTDETYGGTPYRSGRNEGRTYRFSVENPPQ